MFPRSVQDQIRIALRITIATNSSSFPAPTPSLARRQLANRDSERCELGHWSCFAYSSLSSFLCSFRPLFFSDPQSAQSFVYYSVSLFLFSQKLRPTESLPGLRSDIISPSGQLLLGSPPNPSPPNAPNVSILSTWKPQFGRRCYTKLGPECLTLSPVIKPSKLDEVQSDAGTALYQDELNAWVGKYVSEYDSFQSVWLYAEVVMNA